MSVSKKITITATCTAIAVCAVVVSRFFPLLSISPLVIAAFCFFIAMRVGLSYGFLSVAVTLSLALLMGGINTTFLLTAVLFAPYSVLAHFIRAFRYKNGRHALVRVCAVTALFNAVLLLFVFVLAKFMLREIIFGYNMEGLTDYFSGGFGLILLMLIVTAFAVITDIIFVMASTELEKRVKYFKPVQTKNPKTDKKIDVFTDDYIEK